MQRMNFLKNKMLSIQYMRGIAALLVVCFHYRSMLNHQYTQQDIGNIFRYGNFGVDLFFMISGYIISLSTKNSKSKKDFVIKRFFRIFPVYWFLLIILFLVLPNVKFDFHFLKSLFLIQKDYLQRPPFFGYSLLSVAWTLSFEMVFYSFFVMSMYISHKYRSLVCSIIILLIVCVLQYLYNGGVSYSGYSSAETDISIFRLLSCPVLFEFIFGMFVFEFSEINFSIYENKCFKYILNILLTFSFMYVLACYWSGYNFGHGFQGFGSFVSVFFFLFVLYEKINGVRELKTLKKLGDWSYSIYLTHMSLLMMFPILAHYLKFFAVLHGANKFILLIMITLLISKIIYDCIEQKFMSFSRWILK